MRALEPGGVENLPMKDEVLLKDLKVGDGGKGGNFLLNSVLNTTVLQGFKDQRLKAEQAK